MVSHNLCFPINWDDQSRRVTRRCSGNVTLRADSRLSTACHCTPCARAPASQTDQRDWGCTSAPVSPLELGSQPCPPRGTEHSELPRVIKAQLTRAGSRAEQWEGEAMFPRRGKLASSMALAHLQGWVSLPLPLLHLQQGSLSLRTQCCPTRQHWGREGSCLESLAEKIIFLKGSCYVP